MTPKTVDRRTNHSLQMVSEIKFECAHCGQKIAVGSDAVGLNLECPTCQNSVTIPPEFIPAEPRKTEGGQREKLAALQLECERLRANATHSQAEIKSFQAERLALRNEAAALKQRVSVAEAQMAQMDVLHQRLDATETQLAAVEREHAENQAALSRAHSDLVAAAQELGGLRSELAAAVGFAEGMRAELSATKVRLAETEIELKEALGKLTSAESDANLMKTRFTEALAETESLRRLTDHDETSRELLITRERLSAADEELRTRRQNTKQLEGDLIRAESERARLDEERNALHRRLADALKQAEDLSENRVITDNAKLRELLDRQNEELKLRFRELTRFRRAKLTLKIAWALATIGAIALGYFFVNVLPTIEWTQ